MAHKKMTRKSQMLSRHLLYTLPFFTTHHDNSGCLLKFLIQASHNCPSASHKFLPIFLPRTRNATTCWSWAQDRYAGANQLAHILHLVGNGQRLGQLWGLSVKKQHNFGSSHLWEHQNLQYLCLKIDRKGTVTRHNNLANCLCAQAVNRFGNTVIRTSLPLAISVFQCSKPFSLLVSK